MEFQYWWLLGFPLFFLLGWLAARIDIRHIISQSRQLPEAYFRGLNYLLNQQPDKAIEAFTEAARVEDSEAVELSFTLGGLFRRRGEVERAISLHANLMERPDLGRAQRLAAQLELGQDYLKAGLLDRAETLFSEMLHTPHEETARRFLMEIYVQEQDWPKAIAAAEALARAGTRSYQVEISHFHCELAVLAAASGDLAKAEEHLTLAARAHRRNARALLLAGDFRLAAGDAEGAIQTWKRIEAQNPEFTGLAAEKLIAVHRQLERLGEACFLLRTWLANHASVDLFTATFDVVLECEGVAQAHGLARETLRRHPSLQVLTKLLEAQLMAASSAARHELQMIKDLVQSHAERLAYYQCEACGFKAQQFFWRCPACGGWETLPPRRLEEAKVAKGAP